MTVADITPVITYIGNGATTVFPFAFWVQKDEDLYVYKKTIATGVLAALTLNVDYIATGVSLTSGVGGSVVLIGTPLSSSYKLVIARVVAETQDLDITNEDGFNPTVVEFQFDRIVMMTQQAKEQLRRAMQVQLGEAVSPLANHIYGTDGAGTFKDLGELSPANIIVVGALGDTFVNVKTHFGVLGDGSIGDSALINAAMQDIANLGKTLYFPAGIYSTTVGFTMTVQMNIYMDQRAVLRGDFVPADGKDVLRINIATGSGDGRNMIIEGGSILNNGGGNCAINVNSTSGTPETVPQYEMEIRNGNHAGYLRAIRFGAAAPAGNTNFNTVRQCNISTGSSGSAAIDLDGCADGHRIIDNLIFGTGVGIKVNVVLGAFNTIIRGNGIVTQNGAILVTNGSRVLIRDNQIEQTGVNGLVPSSHILIQGLARISRGIIIKGNNLGGGTNVDTLITMYNARGTKIDENHMNKPNVQDINFGDAGSGLIAKYNTLGPDNWLRGVRSLQTGRTDTSRHMIIAEAAACVGNRGFWKPLPTLQGGYTDGGGLQYMVNQMGDWRVKGILIPGSLTAGQLICTFPAGARPQALQTIPVGTGSTTLAMLQFLANGELRVHSGLALPTGDCTFGHAAIAVEWLDTYEAGE